ncbi:MAG: hypothetical protein AAF567_24440 [Actinomycetota bacterium]
MANPDMPMTARRDEFRDALEALFAEYADIISPLGSVRFDQETHEIDPLEQAELEEEIQAHQYFVSNWVLAIGHEPLVDDEREHPYMQQIQKRQQSPWASSGLLAHALGAYQRR